MKSTRLAAVLVALPTVLVAATTGAAPPAPTVKAAPPTVPPTAQPSPTNLRPMPRVKVPVDLAVTKAATVPGEKRTYEALLKTKAGAPIPNRKVSFRIEGKNGTTVPNGVIAMGSANTDSQGRARLDFSCPELAQGNYALKASFAGDDDFAADTAEENLLVVKATTKLELSDLVWGTYKNEPGSPWGSINIVLRRTSDNQALSKPLVITVNGQTWTLSGSSLVHSVPLPSAASTWNVKVQFEGDAANIATAAERTYKKPS